MLNRPALVADYFKSIAAGLEVERFWVLCLNRKNRLKKLLGITSGTATSSLAHPREVFRAAIQHGARGVVVHNDPSGDPSPSAADLQVTRQLRDAARAVDIDLVDHIIVGVAHADSSRLGLLVIQGERCALRPADDGRTLKRDAEPGVRGDGFLRGEIRRHKKHYRRWALRFGHRGRDYGYDWRRGLRRRRRVPPSEEEPAGSGDQRVNQSRCGMFADKHADAAEPCPPLLAADWQAGSTFAGGHFGELTRA